MSDALGALDVRLKEGLGDRIASSVLAYGELTVTVPKNDILEVLKFLRDDPQCCFVSFIDISGADYPEREERFDVVYHLLSPKKNMRVRVKVQADALEAIKKNPEVAVDALAKRLSVSPEISRKVVDLYFKNPPTLESQIDPKSRYTLVGDGGLYGQLKLASETYVALGVLKEAIPEKRLRDAIDPQYLKAYVESGKK